MEEKQLQTTGPDNLIEMALTRGADEKALEKLEKVLLLKEKYDANEARKVYHEAMAAFKTNPPSIAKDKTVSYAVQGKGTTTYNHASLANVTEQINKALSEHGLSAAWITEQLNGGITVTCTITHKFGHSEKTSLTAPPDTSGSKNVIQAIGSTITYLQRYTLLALAGLATHEADDDGRGSEVEYITEKQLKELKEEYKKRNVDDKKFLAHFGVESIEQLLSKGFPEAMSLVKGCPAQRKQREPGEEG